MMTAWEAWDQMNDAATRMAALQAQRAAEIRCADDVSPERQVKDAQDHVRKMRYQQNRLLKAHADLIAHADVFDAIDALLVDQSEAS